MTDGYTQSYGSGEVSEVAIDIVVGIGAFLFSVKGLVAIVLLFRW